MILWLQTAQHPFIRYKVWSLYIEYLSFPEFVCCCFFQLKDYNKDYKKETIFDKVFKRSLNAFHKEMQATISIEKQVCHLKDYPNYTCIMIIILH